MKTRKAQRVHRHNRIRSKIFGSTKKPRLSVYRSSKHIYAQLIDDEKNQTIFGLSDEKAKGKTKEEKAASLGEMVAKMAAEKKIKEIVFDRGGHKYIGRVKALAEAARKAGLQF